MSRWPEVSKAATEGRHELVLSGAGVSKRIDDETEGGLPGDLYALTGLNFLDVSNTTLKFISAKIPNLCSLTHLAFGANQLSEVPEELGLLVNLKTLDLSRNQLTSLPSIGQLEQLHTLLVSNNKLASLPDLSGAKNLSRLDASFNELTEFPDCLFTVDPSHLTDLLLRSNQLSEIPSQVGVLSGLKSLDLSQNSIKTIPVQLAECRKLKDLNLTSNSIKERRLAKIVADPHHKIHVLLDAIAKFGTKDQTEQQSKGKSGAKNKKGGKKKTVEDSEENETEKDKIFITIASHESETRVTKTESVDQVRPYLACCIVRDLNLKVDGRFKKFLNLQNQLHSDESLCKKRCAAAIATHDLDKVTAPFTYTARQPEELLITALGRSQEETGKALVARLTEEAEIIRKKEKRNNFSGIHKYLNLVKNMRQYPCLVDADGKVLSFAPVTNADISKMSRETSDLLIEVSSSESQSTCKRVMDKLLTEMLALGLGNGENEENGRNKLLVEQVKVVTEEGMLRVAYPDRLDLDLSSVCVHREQCK